MAFFACGFLSQEEGVNVTFEEFDQEHWQLVRPKNLVSGDIKKQAPKRLFRGFGSGMTSNPQLLRGLIKRNKKTKGIPSLNNRKLN